MTRSQKLVGHLAHRKWSAAATAYHKQHCKHVLSAIFRAALAVTAIAATSRADAEPILLWGLQDVIFSSGQSAVGSFTVQGSLTDWNIHVIGGTDPTLTDITFQPGGNCVVFCGELISAGTPQPSVLDVRTPLASDNTFFELVLFLDAPLADLFNPATAQIEVHSASSIDYALLLNPTTVQLLKRNERSSTTAYVRVAPVPEPASLFLFAVGSAPLAILATYRLFRRISPAF